MSYKVELTHLQFIACGPCPFFMITEEEASMAKEILELRDRVKELEDFLSAFKDL